MRSTLRAAVLLAAAVVLFAQQKTVLGTVTKFKVDSLELGVHGHIPPAAATAAFREHGLSTGIRSLPPPRSTR